MPVWGSRTLVAVPADTRCWLQRPLTTEHTYTYKGEVHAKRVVASPTQTPLTVDGLGGEACRLVRGIAGRSPKAPKAR